MTDLVNQSTFAEMIGVTQQSISKAIKNDKVIRDESGLIDLDNEKNYQYLREAGERSKKRARNKKKKEKIAAQKKSNKKILEEIAKKESKRRDIQQELDDDIDESVKESDQIANDFKKSRAVLAEAKAKHYYDELLDRELVSKVFDELEKVIRRQGLTVGARCAPVIAAEFGRNTTEDRRFVQSEIDKEQTRFLEGIKRALKRPLKNDKK